MGIEEQRAARLAREAEQAQEAARAAHRKSAAGFWDNVDTSGGPDACHPWTGEAKWNHPPNARARFLQGRFDGYDGAESYMAARVAVFAVYGRPVPKDHDVTPICGDHLCTNLRHFAITPHGGNGHKRVNKGVPVAEFFCAEVKAA